jgi:prepilin-type N-terminal cleavage/methylation domain-containing protein
MKRGFTLIELMIVVAILGIILACIFRTPEGTSPDGTVCRAGYKYTYTGGNLVQVIGQNGGGVPCGS